MAEPADVAGASERDAVALLRRARVDLERLDGAGAGNRVRRALVVTVADRLGALARDPSCPDRLGVLLHDWRDRLGSHVLVAEALGEMEVHPDLADQLLLRGVVEVLEEAPERLAQLSRRATVSAAAVTAAPATPSPTATRRRAL